MAREKQTFEWQGGGRREFRKAGDDDDAEEVEDVIEKIY